jgi:hypothetical protein
MQYASLMKNWPKYSTGGCLVWDGGQSLEWRSITMWNTLCLKTEPLRGEAKERSSGGSALMLVRRSSWAFAEGSGDLCKGLWLHQCMRRTLHRHRRSRWNLYRSNTNQIPAVDHESTSFQCMQHRQTKRSWLLSPCDTTISILGSSVESCANNRTVTKQPVKNHISNDVGLGIR